jgi:hypothetical protein
LTTVPFIEMPFIEFTGLKGPYFFPSTTPSDPFPIPFDPELPEEHQFYHTPAQYAWRKQIMNKVIKHREELNQSYEMGWREGVTSPYAAIWKRWDEQRGTVRKFKWKDTVKPIKNRSPEAEKESLDQREKRSQKKIRELRQFHYHTGTSFPKEKLGVITAARGSDSAALAEAEWGKWSHLKSRKGVEYTGKIKRTKQKQTRERYISPARE